MVPQDQRLVYTQRVEEIAPNLRYCAYNIGGLPTDVAQLMKMRQDGPGFDMLASKIDVSPNSKCVCVCVVFIYVYVWCVCVCMCVCVCVCVFCTVCDEYGT